MEVQKLSLVAQYDDLVRNRSVLSSGIESGTFALNHSSIVAKYVDLVSGNGTYSYFYNSDISFITSTSTLR